MRGDWLDQVLTERIRAYCAAHPKSNAIDEMATQVIPDGTARSAINCEPFPLRVARASGARLFVVDGDELIDFCGDFTACLFGHDPEVIRTAVHDALAHGWALGATHPLEVEVAQLLCSRFPGIERVRFTNSGTEANLLAIATALHHTTRDAVVVFEGGFHGSVLAFDEDPHHRGLNVPHRFVVCRYNDITHVRRAFDEHSVGCVVVELMQGAGGCRPATLAFVRELRAECERAGALLIFDEVMTSRLFPGGLQQKIGVRPDLTTLGKYLAGGLSFGAFGGRSELMAHFATRDGGTLRHSGTFNNNVASMAAALAVLKQLWSDDAFIENNARGDKLRRALNTIFDRHYLPLFVSGLGSMLYVHAVDRRWLSWLFHDLLTRGFYTSPRGFIALSFAVTDEDCRALHAAVADWAAAAAGVRSAQQR